MAIKSRFEVLDRKSNFEKTHTEIKEHNENKDATFVMEHNTFSVMVKKILALYYLGQKYHIVL